MDNKEFGILLKTLRKQKNMTQEKLAVLLNVSTSAVCKWERGNNLPDVSMFQKIAEIYEVSIEDLLNPTEAIYRLENAAATEDISVAQVYIQAENSANNEASVAAPVAKRNLPIPRKTLTIPIAFLPLFIVSTLIYMHIFQNSNLHIYPYSSRVATDEYVGTVYEYSYIYEGDFSQSELSDTFLMSIANDWKENNEVPADITILKVSFYSSKELAKQWVTPTYSTYFLR